MQLFDSHPMSIYFLCLVTLLEAYFAQLAQVKIETIGWPFQGIDGVQKY